MNIMHRRQDYSISGAEINRRKRAFNSLIVSLFIGVTLTLKLLLDMPYSYLLVSMAAFAGFLVIGRLLMETAFNSFRKIRVILTASSIERKTFKSSENIDLKEILGISIKKTVKKKIREIKILTKEKQFYLNGLVHMDDLYESLKNMVNPDIKISQRQESIDFDSPFFYPVLGFLLGSGIIWLMKMIMKADDRSFYRAFSFSTMILALALGGYFIFAKPISKSHGSRYRLVDTVIGIVFFILWLGLLVFIFYSSTDIL